MDVYCKAIHSSQKLEIGQMPNRQACGGCQFIERGAWRLLKPKQNRKLAALVWRWKAYTSQYWEKAKGYINSWHFKYFFTSSCQLANMREIYLSTNGYRKKCSEPHGTASTVLLWNKATPEFPRWLLNFLFVIRAGCSHPGRAGECFWDKEGIRQPSSKLTLKATHSALQSSRPWNRAGRGQGVPDHAGDSGMHSLDTVIWLSSLLLWVSYSPTRKRRSAWQVRFPSWQGDHRQ